MENDYVINLNEQVMKETVLYHLIKDHAIKVVLKKESATFVAFDHSKKRSVIRRFEEENRSVFP